MEKNLEEQCTSEQLWCGGYVKIIDTTTVTVADTKENQLRYPQASSQKAGNKVSDTPAYAVFSHSSLEIPKIKVSH